jgi:hypothetical protein
MLIMPIGTGHYRWEPMELKQTHWNRRASDRVGRLAKQFKNSSKCFKNKAKRVKDKEVSNG